MSQAEVPTDGPGVPGENSYAPMVGVAAYRLPTTSYRGSDKGAPAPIAGEPAWRRRSKEPGEFQNAVDAETSFGSATMQPAMLVMDLAVAQVYGAKPQLLPGPKPITAVPFIPS